MARLNWGADVARGLSRIGADLDAIRSGEQIPGTDLTVRSTWAAGTPKSPKLWAEVSNSSGWTDRVLVEPS